MTTLGSTGERHFVNNSQVCELNNKRMELSFVVKSFCYAKGCILPAMCEASAYKQLPSGFENGTEVIGSLHARAEPMSITPDCGVRSTAQDDLLCFIRLFSNRTIRGEFLAKGR